MKNLLILFLLFVSPLSFADGLDEMRIYINQKPVAVCYEGGSQLLELEVSEGDTLRFELTTDWGGEFGGTVSIFDNLSSEQLFELLPRSPNEARFEQRITPALLDGELLFVFNFSRKTAKKWKFARVILKKRPN